MISLDQIVKKIQQIPPMPDVVLKVLELSEDPDISVQALVEVIKLDQGITFRVLRLCNSAYYGLPREVSSLREALVFLGNNTLVNFILTSYASDFYQAPNAGYGLEAGELWRHAVATAIASDLIGQRVHPGEDTGLLFTAGLLHDVGKIILNEYVLADIDKLRECVEKGDVSFVEAEKEVLGYSHAEVGAQVAAHWNLPPVLVNSILYHHDPAGASECEEEVAMVHLGNVLVLMIGYGIGEDGLQYHFDHTAMSRFNFEMQDLMSCSADVQGAFNKAVELLKLNE